MSLPPPTTSSAPSLRADPTADWLSASDALAAVMRAVAPLEAETRPLLASRGRILADDVVAEVSLPPWDNSAMDGFAVRAEDVRGASASAPARLRVVDDVPAGGFPNRAIGAGEAARVMTGAPVPEGCDGVIRVEHTMGGGGAGTIVAVLDDADAGRNIRPAGDDIYHGDIPLAAGQELTAARIAVAASLGFAELRVVRRPVVALLTSGDELVAVEDFEQVRQGRRIVSSNSYGLAAALAEIGCEVRMLGIARDTPESLREHLLRAEGCDAVITSAGVSVGEHDHVKRVIADLEGDISFWRVRARPGSALVFGHIGALGGIPWFGLPGNPVSTLACFELFARPALLRMAGHTAVYPRTHAATLADAYGATGGSTHFARVRLQEADDEWTAHLTRSQSSGVTTAIAEADALAVIPPGPARSAGSLVRTIILGGAPLVTDPPF
jgi:molybdopterin molybdotransferase